MSLETKVETILLDKIELRDTKIRRAALRGCGSELVKLGIPQDQVNKYHYQALEYYCNKPQQLIEDDIDLIKDLTLHQRNVLQASYTLDEYIVIVETERMGTIY